MLARWLAVALLFGACGKVESTRPDAAPPTDAAIADTMVPARMYRGTLDRAGPVTFGGLPFCEYTMTLTQIDLEIGILPGGQVVNGRSQNLNTEAPVPPCPNGSIPPSIAMYTFKSAKPIQNGMQLTFTGAAVNNPGVDLTVDVMSVGTAFQARLGYHRYDQPPPLDWSVIAMLSLSPR